MSETHPNVVHADHVASVETERGPHRFTRRKLAGAAGGQQLGCSHVTLPPGGRSWPRHWHAVNEEAIYILEGEGVALIGDARVPVSAGDYVALPVGPDHAHQMRNESDAPLTYLCISTMHPYEIAGYADTGKLYLMAGAGPGDDKSKRFLDVVGHITEAGYWDGEGEATPEESD